MRACVQAATQPVTQWNKLKREYEFCLEDTMDEIAREMGRDTPISSNEK
jgi:hypothetical protein